MVFELEALSARKGDALVLRWGSPGSEKTALIDGGPSGVWSSAIQPRLAQLAGTDPAGSPLPAKLDLVVVTHVDDDHIRGILDMAEAIDRARKQAEDIPVRITEVWHNAFSDAVNAPEFADEPELVGALDEAAAAPESLDQYQAPAPEPGARELVASAESIRQGTQLDQILRVINVARNTSFQDRQRLVRAGDELNIGGLKVHVLAPSDESLNELKELWKAEEPAKSQEGAVKALAAAFDDPSVPNMSSIVLLAEHAGQRMLLTGDARGDQVIEAIERFTGSKHPLKVDILKIPHHGSAHSNSPELFERVIADHYVISGNGEHGNPHPDTLRALFETQKDRKITFYLTNTPTSGARKPEDIEKAKQAEAVLAEAKLNPNVTLVMREEGQLGVKVTL